MQDILIARQPVFDHNLNLSSYELLFRGPNELRESDDKMTAQVVVAALLDIGFEKLSAGHMLNINASESLLLHNLDIIHSLPPSHVGIEILETTPVTKEIIQVCKTLKDKGYTLLLDDVVYAPHLKPFIELANIIKVDLPQVRDLANDVKILRQYPAKLLAEKVETREDYEQVKALEFDYVQGYFFCKPQIIKGKKLPDSKLSTLQALQEVMLAKNVNDVFDVIKHDVSLSYRLMKYINSACFGFRTRIESVEQALTLIGLDNIRRWLSLLALAALSTTQTPEILRTALIRASTLEHIAKHCHEPETGDDFLLGMFSILDTLLNVHMQDALSDLHLPTDVHEGLLNKNSDMGKKLAMCIALERGDIDGVQQWLKGKEGIDLSAINQIHFNALLWADKQTAELT
jgi:EAL and modified HD-GYP domain-containing signal transduction protein